MTAGSRRKQKNKKRNDYKKSLLNLKKSRICEHLHEILSSNIEKRRTLSYRFVPLLVRVTIKKATAKIPRNRTSEP